MKRYISFIIPMLLVSCADDHSLFSIDEPSQDNEIKLQSTIEQHYNSRVNDGGFTDGDAIGVYIVDYKNSEAQPLATCGNHADNVKFSFIESDNSWSGASKLYWTDDIIPVDAYSYFPYSEQVRDVNAYEFHIETNQNREIGTSSLLGYEASDFLWAKAENVHPGAVINLNHRHIMTCVQVTLVEGEGFEAGTWDKLEKNVWVENTRTSALIDLSSGSVSATGTVETINPHNSYDDWRAIVVPQTLEADLTLLTITVDGESYKFSREVNSTYQSGKMHSITLQVDKRPDGDYKFMVIHESITPWEADNITHNGAAKIYTIIHNPEPGGLEQAVASSNINIDLVENLKLTGYMNGADAQYFKEHFTHILALNLKDVNFRDCSIISWLTGPEPTYGITDDGAPGESFESSIYHNLDDAIPVCFLGEPYYGEYEFTSLQHIVLPETLKYIGAFAFFDVPITGTLEIPDGVKWIGGCGFSGYGAQSYITNLILPSSLEYIGGYCFSYLPITNEILLPENIKYIGDFAFSNCTQAWGTIHLPESLVYIGHSAFCNVPLTGNLVWPANIKTITNAFDSTKATSVHIPEGITEINEGAFSISSLKGDIRIPSSVTSLGRGAFIGSKISHITFSTVNGKSKIENLSQNVLYGCKYLTDTVTIPEGVVRINSGFFTDCSNLRAVNLPSTLEIIGDNTENNIWRVFGGCTSLEYIRCDALVPPTCIGDPFAGVAKDNFTLVVPEESIEDYQNAEYWREFKRISAYRNLVFRPQIAKVLNAGGKREVILNADAGKKWTVTECPSWMHISPTSGTGKTTLTITMDAMDHGSPNRDGEIVVNLSGTDYTTSFHAYQFDYQYDEDAPLDIQTHSIGRGVPLVFIGEGYDAEDIANGTYIQDMSGSIERFLDVEPYNTYRNYFDIYTAFALSYESGIGSLNYLRNTKFGADIGDGKLRLQANYDDVALYALDNIPAVTNRSSDLTVVLTLNTNAYEGITCMYPSGLAVALATKSDAEYPYDWRGVIQHEAGGHGFGKFADEYIYHNSFIQNCKCICCSHTSGLLEMQAQNWGMNLSLSSKTEDLPWVGQMRDSRTNDITDVWTGGYFHKYGVYRPEWNTCMNDNVPYYSTWCRELIVRRIMSIAGQTFNFDDFISKDVRGYGTDFTLGSRGSNIHFTVAPIEGQAPLIRTTEPKRNNKKSQY